ncbi:MAG: LPS export ABC transporter periplasmic protein LptC [Hydrogenophilus sp.]|nr:LPS export ABC transporter periplasmic protein LptC [Hydrogenophilus sp.]
MISLPLRPTSLLLLFLTPLLLWVIWLAERASRPSSPLLPPPPAVTTLAYGTLTHLYDRFGKLQHAFTAQRLDITENGHLHFQALELTSRPRADLLLYARADSGRWDEAVRKLDAEGTVRLLRITPATRDSGAPPTVVLATEAVTLWPDEGRAHTQTPALLLAPDRWARADQIHAEDHLNRFRLFGSAHLFVQTAP